MWAYRSVANCTIRQTDSKKSGNEQAFSESYNSRAHRSPRSIEDRATRLSSLTEASFHRNFVPRMHAWNTTFSTPTSSIATDMDYLGPSVSTNESASFPSVIDNSSITDYASSIPIDNDLATNEDDNMGGNGARLKGVLWPGMDIFDSATPEMRRKRNQKKDVSVVEQLESNSLVVEPTELVFTPAGSEWKSRSISGLPYDDSSPFRDLSADRLHAVSTCRVPLTELDGNIPLPQNNGSNLQHRRQLSRNGNFSRNKNSAAPIHSKDEVDKNIQNPSSVRTKRGRKRKRAFNVFEDEVNFSCPAGFSYLTAEFANPDFDHLSSNDVRNIRSLNDNINTISAKYEEDFRDHSIYRRNPRRACQQNLEVPQQQQSQAQEQGSLRSSMQQEQPRHTDIDTFYPSQKIVSNNILPSQYVVPEVTFQDIMRSGQPAPNQPYGYMLNQCTNLPNSAFTTPVQGFSLPNFNPSSRLSSIPHEYSSSFMYQYPYLGNSANKGGTRLGTSSLCQQNSYNSYSQGPIMCDGSVEEQLKMFDVKGVDESVCQTNNGTIGEEVHRYDHQDYGYALSIGAGDDDGDDDQRTISAPPSDC